jgi:hypothetical protein
MSDQSGFSIEDIKRAARDVMSSGPDLREKLHALTVEALTRRQLAEQEIREVLQAITEGVSLGAAERTEEVRGAIQDALKGIDDALGNAAEAMQQAWSETSSHAREFAEQDLQQGLEDLKKLEAIFLETIHRVGEGAGSLVRQEMLALGEQTRRVGTDTGARVLQLSEALRQRLRASARQAGIAGRQAALEAGSRVAELASRKLSGLAARIAAKAEQLKQQSSDAE